MILAASSQDQQDKIKHHVLYQSILEVGYVLTAFSLFLRTFHRYHPH